MKKTIASFLIVLFLASAMPRQALANHRRGSSPAALGAVAGIFHVIFGFVYFLGKEKEDTEKLAITEGNRTKREGIRSGTVLSAPSALGGKGKASYKSTEGEAHIEAESALGGQGQTVQPDSSSPEVEKEEELEIRYNDPTSRRNISYSAGTADSARSLSGLQSWYDTVGATPAERRAVAHVRVEMESPRPAYTKEMLRDDLERLNDLYDRAQAYGIQRDQLAPLKEAIWYLDRVVFGRRQS